MARRKAASRTRANSATPAWMWLMAGILIGLAMAWYLFAKGYIPQPEAMENGTGPGNAETSDSEEIAPVSEKEKKASPRYDFFTILPEMEVVVPEEELSRQSRAEPETPVTGNSEDEFYLQVGSFREMADAEKRKAQLALLGEAAEVQKVTVNGATWHRVRIGPVKGTRSAEAKRNRLADNGIESLVLRNP